MLFSKSRFVRSTFSAVALVLAAQPLAAFAETIDEAAAADGEDGQLDAIVVTAQKREENLQETPIAISVLSGDQLVNRHAQSLLDLGDGAIPSRRLGLPE